MGKLRQWFSFFMNDWLERSWQRNADKINKATQTEYKK
jgi:hypothetical protein|tara:strand:- start:1332 stop:1445 length:114 start_codon:yes stop_codon:yes gene_type:complete